MTDDSFEYVTTERVASESEIEPLGEGRFVVRTDGGATGTESPNELPPVPSLDPEPVDTDGMQYGLEVTIRSEHGTHHDRAATNDVREGFDALLAAYAEAVAPGHDPERAIETLLAESRFDPR